ncbi:hypothetical protein C8Q80DRAFT_1132119, partial [Daedaleopsis nitida]
MRLPVHRFAANSIRSSYPMGSGSRPVRQRADPCLFTVSCTANAVVCMCVSLPHTSILFVTLCLCCCIISSQVAHGSSRWHIMRSGRFIVYIL